MTYDHRKSQVTLAFRSPSGVPLARRRVRLEQVSHAFLFGCGGFDAVELAGVTDPARRSFLEERLDKTFAFNNYATLPFYWGRYESVEGRPEEERTRAGAAWLAARGIALKGHPLCWHTVCADWLLKYPVKEALKRQLGRIEREVGRFAGLIDRWDVINEVVIMPDFDRYDNGVTRLCKALGRVGLVKAVFAEARAANPGATLLINDFNTTTNYEILIDGCLQAGVPIDVIGIQSHQHQGYWGAERLREVLDRFGHFGLPLHFTENTLISGDLMPAHIVDLNDWKVESWPSTAEGEARQAREMVEMYEILFGDPRVEAITVWDNADGKWLGAPSGLLRVDNSVKPVWEALRGKITGEWMTRVEAATDDAGRVDLTGFRGGYTAVVEGGARGSFTLDGGRGVVEVSVGEGA